MKALLVALLLAAMCLFAYHYAPPDVVAHKVTSYRAHSAAADSTE